MIHGLYESAAGALVQSSRFSVLTNNLANLATVGFKSDFSFFMQRAHEAVESGRLEYSDPIFRDAVGDGVFLKGTLSILQQGGMEATEDPFDIAVDGSGFLPVTDGKETYYTRNGRLSMTKDGTLTTSNGAYRLLDDKGRPIRINPNKDLHISISGELVQDGTTVARLGVAKIDDPRQLRKFGRTLFTYEGQGAPALTGGRFRQGYLEKSNVNTVQAMTELIEASRMFEANMRLLQMQDATLGRLMEGVATAQ